MLGLLMMMMMYSLWSNECPCCHDKEYTDNNGNQRNDKKNNQCILVIFHRFERRDWVLVYKNQRKENLMINLPRLEIDEAGSWDVAFIISLVKEDVFAIIAAGSGEILQNAIVVDSVFQAQLFPKLSSNLKEERGGISKIRVYLIDPNK